jgi:copper chaperone CopZ
MELGDLDGVESVAVDVEKKEVRLEYSTPATTKSIETLLAEINYPVEKTL